MSPSQEVFKRRVCVMLQEWFSNGRSSARLMIVLDLRDLFLPEQFYDSKKELKFLPETFQKTLQNALN